MNAGSIELRSPTELIEMGELLGGFVFRGHGSVDWRLETTLERAAARWGVERPQLPEREQTLIRAFQRRAHHYVSDPPVTSELLEWAALLQHYGGPTRLLDVTESYLAAAFFAVERATGDAVIWAFNPGRLDRPEEKPIDYDGVISGIVEEHGVCLVEPFRQNRRLATQQGSFLMPLSLQAPFSEQLEGVMAASIDSFTEISSPAERREHLFEDVWRIIIPKEVHSSMMRFLSRSNVSAATLFEGLEGFARSLHTVMRIYDG